MSSTTYFHLSCVIDDACWPVLTICCQSQSVVDRFKGVNLSASNKCSAYLEKAAHSLVFRKNNALRTVFHEACFPANVLEFGAVDGTFFAFLGKSFFDYGGMSFIGSSIFLQGVKV